MEHVLPTDQTEQQAPERRGGLHVYHGDQLVFMFQSQEATTWLLDSLPLLQAADDLLTIAAGTGTGQDILPPVNRSPSVSSTATLVPRAPSTASTRSGCTFWRNMELVSLQSCKRRALNPLEEADTPDISLPIVSRPAEYAVIYYYIDDRHDHDEPYSSRVLRDNSGNVVTSAQLSELLGPCPLMTVSTVSEFYLQKTRNQLVPSRVGYQDFHKAMERMEGFEIWSLNHSETSFLFLQRQGLMLQPMRQTLKSRLRLFDGPNAVVLSPLLCYHLLLLGCIPVDQLTGFVLNAMFKRVCGRELSSLNVVTGEETRTMTDDEICEMVITWAIDMCLYVSVGERMTKSLYLATRCFEMYENTCVAYGNNGTILDQDGGVAKDMLARNKCLSKLYLCLRPIDLKILYKRLPYLMRGVLGEDIIESLRLAATDI